MTNDIDFSVPRDRPAIKPWKRRLLFWVIGCAIIYGTSELMDKSKVDYEIANAAWAMWYHIVEIRGISEEFLKQYHRLPSSEEELIKAGYLKKPIADTLPFGEKPKLVVRSVKDAGWPGTHNGYKGDYIKAKKQVLELQIQGVIAEVAEHLDACDIFEACDQGFYEHGPIGRFERGTLYAYIIGI